MTVISVMTQTTGTIGIPNKLIYITTNDPDSVISQTGYLNNYVNTFGNPGFATGQLASVIGTDGTSIWDVVVTRVNTQFIYSLVLNTDGCVTNVTATSPVLSSGGLTPNISLVNQGVAGSYTNANVMCDEYGIITAISNGVVSNLPFTVLTASQTLSANNGYIVNSVSRLNLLLPSSFNVGDEIWIVSLNNSPWRVTQNAGQKITYGVYASTVGVSGYVDSLGPDSVTNCGSVTLVGSTANTVLTVGVAPSNNLNFQ